VPRDIGLYLEDMLEAARRLSGYVASMDRSAFANAPRTIGAVIRNLEVLG